MNPVTSMANLAIRRIPSTARLDPVQASPHLPRFPKGGPSPGGDPSPGGRPAGIASV